MRGTDSNSFSHDLQVRLGVQTWKRFDRYAGVPVERVLNGDDCHLVGIRSVVEQATNAADGAALWHWQNAKSNRPPSPEFGTTCIYKYTIKYFWSMLSVKPEKHCEGLIFRWRNNGKIRDLWQNFLTKFALFWRTKNGILAAQSFGAYGSTKSK